MKLVAFTCPACGAQLNVDIEKGQASCQFCGTTFPIDDEAQHIRYDNAEQAGYEFEKGRQRAQAEFAQSSTQQPYQIPSQPMQIPEQQGRPKKKRKTWLWVLGWIFIFPIPLTILMMRNKKLDEKVRIGIIVIAWIIYIGMGASSGKDKSDASAEGAGSEIEASQTIAEDDKSDSAETSDDNKSDARDSEDAGSQAAEFVIGRLTGVEHIQEPTAATKDHDPNKGLSKDDSYIAAVFFSSDLVEEKVKGDDVIDRGTDGGGCVEVFRNEKDAQARDEYLGSAGSFLSLAGSHTTNGEYVIRTSRYLSDSQQQKLEASIINALTADEAEVAKKAEAEKGVEADKEAETTKKDAATQKKAVDNLVRLVEKSDYCIGTGFPGTPYILFALADNGRADVAYQMLMNTKCPSWLYEVRVGATTIWERWDGLDENGVCPIGDDGTDTMISYNHYASGAVGDFLYRRVAGIEPLEAGYKRFAVKPLLGGGLTWARGSVETPYGTASSAWQLENGSFTLNVEVPVGTGCTVTLPDGSVKTCVSGKYSFSCKV